MRTTQRRRRMAQALGILGSLVILSVSLKAAETPAPVETYSVDAVHSTALFRVKHLDISNTYGRFNDLSGAIAIDPADASKNSIEIEVKVESLDTYNAKRDQHLKGPDFFNSKQFPVMAFKSQSVKIAGEKAYEVVGDFTRHGVTKALTIQVEKVGAGKDPWGGQRIGFETTFTIKRSDFGMTFMPDAVGDEVQITVSLEGIKK